LPAVFELALVGTYLVEVIGYVGGAHYGPLWMKYYNGRESNANRGVREMGMDIYMQSYGWKYWCKLRTHFCYITRA
jgi:hypothetical protein